MNEDDLAKVQVEVFNDDNEQTCSLQLSDSVH